MIPEHIIKLAIDGGYERERYYFDENGNWDYVPELDILNPFFWQALGKVNGWKHPDSKDINEDIGLVPNGEWARNAHNFFDLLMTNGNTAKFWDSITSLNKTI